MRSAHFPGRKVGETRAGRRQQSPGHPQPEEEAHTCRGCQPKFQARSSASEEIKAGERRCVQLFLQLQPGISERFVPCSYTRDKGHGPGAELRDTLQRVENRFWLCSLALASCEHQGWLLAALRCAEPARARGSPDVNPPSGGTADRTHRTLTPRDPAAGHRRGSLVGWTGYTDPALLEETNHT